MKERRWVAREGEEDFVEHDALAGSISLDQGQGSVCFVQFLFSFAFDCV